MDSRLAERGVFVGGLLKWSSCRMSRCKSSKKGFSEKLTDTSLRHLLDYLCMF